MCTNLRKKNYSKASEFLNPSVLSPKRPFDFHYYKKLYQDTLQVLLVQHNPLLPAEWSVH